MLREKSKKTRVFFFPIFKIIDKKITEKREIIILKSPQMIGLFLRNLKN